MSDKLLPGEVVECAEWVLPGHPDKLCDAVADTIVTASCRTSPRAQCGIEAACIFDQLVVTGRIAVEGPIEHDRTVEVITECARDAYATAGYGEDKAGVVWGPRPEDLNITVHARLGEFEEGEAPFRNLSDDQAICVGYANACVETERLPPAHWLARGIARQLYELRAAKGAGQVGPDGKVLVRVARRGRDWRPLSTSVSLHHREESDWMFLDSFVQEAVEVACKGLPTPTIELNGAGMFVCGGPNGDNGQTGKKLVMDAYGPTVPIGGGAWSGKDFWKVDRRGGMLARAIAHWLTLEERFDEAKVVLEYRPGSDAPAHGFAIADGHALELDVSGLTANEVVPPLHFAFIEYGTFDPPERLAETARWGHHRRLGPALSGLLKARCKWRFATPAVPQACAPGRWLAQ